MPAVFPSNNSPVLVGVSVKVCPNLTYCLYDGSISAELIGGCGQPYSFELYTSSSEGILESLYTPPNTVNPIQFSQNNGTIAIDDLRAGCYTLIVFDGLTNCNISEYFCIEESPEPSFDIDVEPNISGVIIPNWLTNDTIPAPLLNDECLSEIAISNISLLLRDI